MTDAKSVVINAITLADRAELARHQAWCVTRSKSPGDRGLACDCGVQVAKDLAAAIRALIPHAVDLPSEALAWAQELLRQGYRDIHLVEFTLTGFALQHPIRCRPDLIGCPYTVWLSDRHTPARPPGRYVMTWSSDDETTFERED